MEHKELGGASHEYARRERWGMEALLSKGGNDVRQGLYTRRGVGPLTKFCKRPHPRAVVFGIIARCYGSVVMSGVVLPVRAREGRLKTGVSQLLVSKKGWWLNGKWSVKNIGIDN